MLQEIRKAAKTRSDLEFNALYEDTCFVLSSKDSNGQELCNGGANRKLTR